MIEIRSREDLVAWLHHRPHSWTQIVAARAAMRVFPFVDISDENWLVNFVLLPLRAHAISWSACSFPDKDMSAAASAAALPLPGTAANYPAAYKAATSSFAAVHSVAYTDVECYAAEDAVGSASHYSLEAAVWSSVTDDCQWLAERDNQVNAAELLSNRSLWLGPVPELIGAFWKRLQHRLLDMDPSYAVWIEWIDRRIRGEASGFDVPGDEGRHEDQTIVMRLAEATNEDFWDRGAIYVNTTLQGWLDEARERAAQNLRFEQDAPENENRPFTEVPKPIFGARAFGLNSEGKLDPLPPYNQQVLRNIPNQRRAYIDVRSAALELQEQGQRLGPKLSPKIARFVAAFPERFEDAEVWPIWSAAVALRTLYWKHKAVSQSPEPDDAKLESAIAMELRGFLDIYNGFAFGDDGLRQKDENSISPQERLKAEELARLSQPVGQAIIDNPSIRTEITLKELKENLDNVLLAAGTPYADQTFDQANKITQNLAVGIFGGARDVLTDPRAVGGELAKLGIKVAATSAAGAALLNYMPLVEFIAINADPLKAYVMTAFQSYPHLTEMIDRISLLWRRLYGTD